MLGRVQRLLNFTNSMGPDDEALSLGNISNGWNSSPGIDDSSLFIQDSAGNTIIRQSNYPTASGGLGDLYQCTRKSDSVSDEVAVKSLQFANLSEIEVAKVDKSIDREVKIWSGLEHQYVLPFYGTVRGFGPFRALVSPWMPNGNLNSYLNRAEVSLTAMDKLNLLRQITEGLKYLHDKNVIHGDLTSNNVLIATDGSPRLADFGILNIIRQSDTTFSYHPGAVRWVAPEFMILLEELPKELPKELLEKLPEELPEEQAEAIQCGTKSGDIYALGCIMFQVLYEKEPYWWLKNALQVIAAKFRNTKPINSSIHVESNYLDFMQQCWSDESKSRPSVDDVLAFIDSLSPNAKTYLQANATRRPVPRTVPTGFFSESHSSQHPDPAITHPISPPPEPHEVLSVPDGAPPEIQPSSPERTQRRFFKWLHPTRPTFLPRVRLHFFQRQTQYDEGVELQERPPSVVDVPLAKANLRNVSKWDIINKKKREEAAKKKREAEAKKKKKMMKEEEAEEKTRQTRVASNSKVSTNAATSSQLPTQNNTIQSSAGPSRPTRSSDPQPLHFTSPSTPFGATTPATAMSSTTAHHAHTLRAGCCTPFLSCVGFVSI